MKGPGYDIQVPWSVRITWSGIYLHDAPWSVGAQGSTNVSHGCVKMAPADAEPYYKMEVTATGDDRRQFPGRVWGNGWTDWFLPWKKYPKAARSKRPWRRARTAVRCQPAVPAPYPEPPPHWRPAVRQRRHRLRQHRG
jgi:hypothetical protein